MARVEFQSKWAVLNLRRNPFGELSIAERRALAVGGLDALAAQVEPGVMLQLRGRCGRGKSSHLHGLMQRLPGATYLRLGRGSARLDGVVLLDEADHVGSLRMAWLLRRATAGAIATHVDRSWALRGLGFRVVDVPVGGADLPKLMAICEARVEGARLGEGPVPTLSEEVAAGLILRFGDDLRAIEEALYDGCLALVAEAQAGRLSWALRA